MESIPPKIVQDRAIPLHQEPRQTGVTAWPESQGEPLVAGLWPRDKKKKQNGEATATGPAWPGLAAVGQGQKWQSLARKSRTVWPAIDLYWPRLAGAKNWSSLPSNLGQPGQDQITGPAYLFRVYLEWSVL